MSRLVKTVTPVFQLSWKKPHYFGVCDEGVDSSVVSLELSADAWLDMGCPSVVTVTVEVGDTLNEETS